MFVAADTTAFKKAIWGLLQGYMRAVSKIVFSGQQSSCRNNF